MAAAETGLFLSYENNAILKIKHNVLHLSDTWNTSLPQNALLQSQRKDDERVLRYVD